MSSTINWLATSILFLTATYIFLFPLGASEPICEDIQLEEDDIRFIPEIPEFPSTEDNLLADIGEKTDSSVVGQVGWQEALDGPATATNINAGFNFEISNTEFIFLESDALTGQFNNHVDVTTVIGDGPIVSSFETEVFMEDPENQEVIISVEGQESGLEQEFTVDPGNNTYFGDESTLWQERNVAEPEQLDFTIEMERDNTEDRIDMAYFAINSEGQTGIAGTLNRGLNIFVSILSITWDLVTLPLDVAQTFLALQDCSVLRWPVNFFVGVLGVATILLIRGGGN